MDFSLNACGGNAPTGVELILELGTPCTFYALDEAGGTIETVTSESTAEPVGVVWLDDDRQGRAAPDNAQADVTQRAIVTKQRGERFVRADGTIIDTENDITQHQTGDLCWSSRSKSRNHESNHLGISADRGFNRIKTEIVALLRRERACDELGNDLARHR